MSGEKGTIGILTGGGDVPGLNPAIRAVTLRALREDYRVIGIRRGWGGLVDTIRDTDADNSNNFQILTEEIVNKAGRTGGTFIHSSRTGFFVLSNHHCGKEACYNTSSRASSMPPNVWNLWHTLTIPCNEEIALSAEGQSVAVSHRLRKSIPTVKIARAWDGFCRPLRSHISGHQVCARATCWNIIYGCRRRLASGPQVPPRSRWHMCRRPCSAV